VVIAPGEVHSGIRVSEGPWVYRAVYPTADQLRALAPGCSGADTAVCFDRVTYADQDLVERFVLGHRVSESGDDGLRAEAEMIECLATLVERHSRPRRSPLRPGSEPKAVARAVEYIEANLGEHLSLSELATVAGLSRYHFARVFARATGLPPHSYVMQRRVRRACRLLRQGLPFLQVACETGFADQSHLTRRFKATIGVTPGEYVRGL
jgi:AraC-like DNA-binding protein